MVLRFDLIGMGETFTMLFTALFAPRVLITVTPSVG